MYQGQLQLLMPLYMNGPDQPPPLCVTMVMQTPFTHPPSYLCSTILTMKVCWVLLLGWRLSLWLCAWEVAWVRDGCALRCQTPLLTTWVRGCGCVLLPSLVVCLPFGCVADGMEQRSPGFSTSPRPLAGSGWSRHACHHGSRTFIGPGPVLDHHSPPPHSFLPLLVLGHPTSTHTTHRVQ